MRLHVVHRPRQVPSELFRFFQRADTLSNVSRLQERWICQVCYYRGLGNALSSTDHGRSSATLPIRFQHGRIGGWRSLSSSSRRLNDAEPRKKLPSHEESQRSPVSKRFTHLMDNVQSNIFIAGQRLNDLTGYSGIETLKRDIEEQERLVEDTRSFLVKAREIYASTIAQRSTSQRESNDLLQRKHAWTPEDLERFTALYRSDHANEMAESTARDELTEAERSSENAASLLNKTILARYHEEQIWSDKIRRMSTWGTWGLMGVNVLLFLVFQIGVEPWRRQRLVKGFEEKVLEALEREDGVSKNIASYDGSSGTVLDGDSNAVETITDAEGQKITLLSSKDFKDSENSKEPIYTGVPNTIPGGALGGIRKRIRDMFSDKEITLRQMDLTTAVLEGAAGGVALFGLVVLFLRPR